MHLHVIGSASHKQSELHAKKVCICSGVAGSIAIKDSHLAGMAFTLRATGPRHRGRFQAAIEIPAWVEHRRIRWNEEQFEFFKRLSCAT